jgi:hypothetical protein
LAAVARWLVLNLPAGTVCVNGALAFAIGRDDEVRLLDQEASERLARSSGEMGERIRRALAEAAAAPEE